jgi:hypothetical protein
MANMIDIKIKDQSNRIHEVKALLRNCPEKSVAQQLKLEQRIEHIIVDGEIIRPSIELLYESQNTAHIYKVLE